MADNPRFHNLLKQMAETHDRKNHDYATGTNPFSNFELAATIAGVTVNEVFRVLLGVKMARLVELESSGKKPNNESLSDTRLDLAVYAALMAAYNMPQIVLMGGAGGSAHTGPGQIIRAEAGMGMGGGGDDDATAGLPSRGSGAVETTRRRSW